MAVAAQLEPGYAGNPVSGGHCGPVLTETESELNEIEGEIPEELCGSFLRTGPHACCVNNVQRYHWFDGDGMVHQVYFKDGDATYRNRWVRTGGFEHEEREGNRTEIKIPTRVTYGFHSPPGSWGKQQRN